MDRWWKRKSMQPPITQSVTQSVNVCKFVYQCYSRSIGYCVSHFKWRSFMNWVIKLCSFPPFFCFSIKTVAHLLLDAGSPLTHASTSNYQGVHTRAFVCDIVCMDLIIVRIFDWIRLCLFKFVEKQKRYYKLECHYIQLDGCNLWFRHHVGRLENKRRNNV